MLVNILTLLLLTHYFLYRECSAVSTANLKGTCMTATECNSKSGGVADGNCAAAFGVCCVVS